VKHDRVPYRRVRMSKEMIQMLEEQKERFRQKFGRYPRPEDPVIWDETASEPTPASAEDIHQTILSALIAAGSPPEFIYAFNKTGRLVDGIKPASALAGRLSGMGRRRRRVQTAQLGL
jgi:hypothetical protein